MINRYHLICTGYLVNITGYRLIYTAYHEAVSGVNQAVIFKFIFLYNFQSITEIFFLWW